MMIRWRPEDEDSKKFWNRLSPKEKQLSFDEEGLSSFTPLMVGFQLARHIQSSEVYDCFCGVGGLTLAFAAAGKKVQGIELNAHRAQLAKNNAKLFNVEDKVDIVCGDAVSVLASIKLPNQAVLLDPSWGGTAYGELPLFKLNHFRPNGLQVLEVAFKTGAEVLMMLPRNFDLNELNTFKRPRHMVENKLNGELLGYSVIFPRISV